MYVPVVGKRLRSFLIQFPLSETSPFTSLLLEVYYFLSSQFTWPRTRPQTPVKNSSSSECPSLVNHVCHALHHAMLNSDLDAVLCPQLLCRTLWAGTASFFFLHFKHQSQFCTEKSSKMSVCGLDCVSQHMSLYPRLPFHNHSAH